MAGNCSPMFSAASVKVLSGSYLLFFFLQPENGPNYNGLDRR